MDELFEEVTSALEKQYSFEAKGKYLRGRCPACNKKEAWTKIDQPYVVFCSRSNECGVSHTSRELFPDLYENFSDRYPSDENNPNATAEAYLQKNRGFELNKIDPKLWTQGAKKTKVGYAETVRFHLWGNAYWERIIDAKKAAQIENGRKAHFSYGIQYAGKHWAPKTYTPGVGQRVFIVEGIFHAIAFDHISEMALSAFTCSNLPIEFIKKHQGQGVVWCLAYDNGKAGQEACLKYRKQLTDMGEACEIHLCESDAIDWDECYRKGLFEKANFWDDCEHRGKLLGADNAKEYAYFLRCKFPYYEQIINYNNAFYTVQISPKLTRELAPHDDPAININSEKGRSLFDESAKVKRISNCFIDMLFRQRDTVFKDQQFLLRVSYQEGHKPEVIEMTGSPLTSLGEFRKVLANKSRASFTGSSENLDTLHEQWMASLKEIDVLPYVGYCQSHKAYIYPNFAVINQRLLKINKDAYFPINSNVGVRTSNDDIEFKLGREYDKDIASIIFRGWGYQGLVTLAAWTASLFTIQLKQHYQDWPFLEMSGAPGAGKTTLIKLLWRMFGRSDDFEGIDVNKTKPAGRAAMFAQISNLPTVIIESDRAESAYGGFDWNEFKDFFGLNGTLRVRGTTEKMKTIQLKFLSTLFFVQNDTIDSDDAILERIVHLNFDIAKQQTRTAVTELIKRDNNKLNGFITAALSAEKEYLKQLIEAENSYHPYYYNDITRPRVVDMHSRLMAAVYALTLFFNISQETLDGCAKYLHQRMSERMKRIGGDHPDVKEFWAAYEYIQAVAKADHQSVNHALEDEQQYIKINLNDFEKKCRDNNQQLKPLKELRKLLINSQSRPYVKHGKEHSPLLNKTIQLWTFKTPKEKA